jgi:hypothetical protein
MQLRRFGESILGLRKAIQLLSPCVTILIRTQGELSKPRLTDFTIMWNFLKTNNYGLQEHYQGASGQDGAAGLCFCRALQVREQEFG